MNNSEDESKNETELAWAAGFFDGEGHTGVARRGGFQIRLRVGQSGDECPFVLTRFQKALGLGMIRGPYPAGRGRRLRWQHDVSGGDAIAAIEALRPYLSPVKIQQADAAIQASNLNREIAGRGDNYRCREGCVCRRHLPETQARRIESLRRSKIARRGHHDPHEGR